MKNQLPTQEHMMGCGLSCVAYVCDISYSEVFDGLDTSGHLKASTSGFFGHELITILKIHGKTYYGCRYNNLLFDWNIVFLRASIEYPYGHWVVYRDFGIFNPWSNYPRILPVESKIESGLRGSPEYVLYEKRNI